MKYVPPLGSAVCSHFTLPLLLLLLLLLVVVVTNTSG